MDMKKWLGGLMGAFISVGVLSDASKLGTELTPLGADPKANAEGTIPAWSGSISGLPEGLTFSSGESYPDPYANEKPLYTITAQNMAEHADKLNEGMKALFKKYPDTFKMPVYQTHREFNYHPDMVARTKWNVGNAKLEGSIDGLRSYTGGVPFPMPTNGAEVMWNSRLSQPTIVSDSVYDEVAVYQKGNVQKYRTKLTYETPLAYDHHPVGKTSEDIGNIAAFVFYEVVEPKRKKGEMVIVHEPIDQFTHDRKAWVYIPGAKRVKRAPNAGYDTPIGPGGLMTADDSMGFNGAMDRYDWTLVGKQEMVVPYHNYKFDSPSVGYKELLPPRHVNQDYMRYELRRVWVVEATLKPKQRHIYAKRRFYIDEDSWLVVATDTYDGRGDLWRTSFNHSLYDFFLKGYVARAQFNYDLQAGAYVGIRLVNETKPTNYAMKIKGEDFYTPANLRKMGRR